MPSKTHKGQGKYILKDLNGQAHVGEVLAIMGSSGAGSKKILQVHRRFISPRMIVTKHDDIESTLMDVLSGRFDGGHVTGDIRFNNHAADVQWRRSIGYVQQDDLFWEMLSVYETLVSFTYLLWLI